MFSAERIRELARTGYSKRARYLNRVDYKHAVRLLDQGETLVVVQRLLKDWNESCRYEIRCEKEVA